MADEINSLNTNSYNSETGKNLLLNAGCLYKNYGIVGKEAPIGATAGGSEFDVNVKTRDVKCDGLHGLQKGLRFVTDMDISLKTALLEVTTENLAMALMANVDSTTDPDYDIIKGKTEILDTDYIENIALVSTISGSNKPCIIIISNVLCTDGLKFKTGDDADNTLATVFTGFGDPLTPEVVPYEIRYPKKTVA